MEQNIKGTNSNFKRKFGIIYRSLQPCSYKSLSQCLSSTRYPQVRRGGIIYKSNSRVLLQKCISFGIYVNSYWPSALIQLMISPALAYRPPFGAANLMLINKSTAKVEISARGMWSPDFFKSAFIHPNTHKCLCAYISRKLMGSFIRRKTLVKNFWD